jgi:Flp pilus assembly protein TadD
VGLATAEAQAGHLARALEHYEKARAMSQDSPDLLNAMAFTCLQAGQRERARELLERSLEMAPEQPSARALLAQVGPRPRG